jgi:ribose transport system ATP-binding protein
MRDELLHLDRITLVVEGIRLLDSLSMHLFTGEILGLVPVNAQGLEELLDLIRRNNPIHYGYIWFAEKLVNDYRKSWRTTNPVAVLEKQTRLIGTMSVADNIFVIRGGMRKYLINDRMLAEQLRLLSANLEIEIPAETAVDRLPLLTRWIVELMKAVVSGAKLIIVRDISNIASPLDLSQIHKVIRHYASQGLSFLYVCNHHEEVFSLCDRAVLLVDGRIVKTLLPNQMNDVVMRHFSASFTRSISNAPHNGVTPLRRMTTKPVLQLRQVVERTIRELTFSVYPGECVVLLDHDNSLLIPFASLIRERRTPEAGSLTIDGKPFRKAGRIFAVIDEKPTRSTLFADLSYLDNLCFQVDGRVPFFWTRRRYRESIRREYLPLLGPVIDASSLADLSLHELYELVYHKILLQSPALVFCIQPFAGIDMYQRLRIIQLIDMLRQKQIAVLIVAVSLSDSLQVADRLLVVQDGVVVSQMDRSEFDTLEFSSASKK